MVPVRTAMALHFARLPFNPKGEINSSVTCSTVRKGGWRGRATILFYYMGV